LRGGALRHAEQWAGLIRQFVFREKEIAAMKISRTLFLACLGLGVLPGCLGRAISETAGKIEGPKGNYSTVARLNTSLAGYTRFEVGTVRDDTGGHMPAELPGMLPEKVQAELARRGLPDDPGGRTAVIRCSILHYEDSTLFANVFGPLEEVIARVELVDKPSGRVLGSANCVGRTRETVNLGVEKKAEGLAVGIAKYIADNYR
jgi:hypothetical protein